MPRSVYSALNGGADWSQLTEAQRRRFQNNEYYRFNRKEVLVSLPSEDRPGGSDTNQSSSNSRSIIIDGSLRDDGTVVPPASSTATSGIHPTPLTLSSFHKSSPNDHWADAWDSDNDDLGHAYGVEPPPPAAGSSSLWPPFSAVAAIPPTSSPPIHPTSTSSVDPLQKSDPWKRSAATSSSSNSRSYEYKSYAAAVTAEITEEALDSSLPAAAFDFSLIRDDRIFNRPKISVPNTASGGHSCLPPPSSPLPLPLPGPQPSI